MNEIEIAELAMEGVIAKAEPSERWQVIECREKIKALVVEYGDLGKVALAV